MATASAGGPQGPLRHQGDRRARRATRRRRAPAQARGRRARPDRARPRRDHRHRHLRDHRRGDRRLRPGDHPLLRPRRRHLRVLRALLRRAGLDDPGLGQRLHVHLRDARRARGVDHRLGPDPRVRACRSPAVAVGWGQYFNDLLDSLFGFTLPEALADPPGEGGTFNLPAVFIVLAVAAVLMRRRPRERAHEHDHGRHQARRAGAVHRARRHRVHGGQLQAVRARTASTASSPPPR